MEYKKLDSKSIEVTNKQVIFEADLKSEKETLEKRIEEINQMLNCLK